MNRRRLRPALALLVSVVLIASGTSCSVDPAALPVPGTAASGDNYPLNLEFRAALNLPTRARVLVNGVPAGTVTGIHVVDDADGQPSHVAVGVDIDSDVELPPSTRAEIRQASVLGDMFVALTVSADDHRPALVPGSTIPLTQTTPPIQIEDTMAAVAAFVNSGAVGQAQQIVARLNAILPDDPAVTAKLSAALTSDVADLGRQVDSADRFFDAIAATTELTRSRADVLRERLTPEGAEQVSSAIETFVKAIGVIGALGPVSHDMVWLAPLAKSGDAAATALVPLLLTSRPLDLSAPSNLNALVALLRDKIIPFVEHGPKVNVRKIRVEDSDAGGPTPTVDATAQTTAIIGALRMIGAVR